MNVISINVGRLREVEHNGNLVRTGIYKQPVSGAAQVRRLGIVGDEQGDPQNHGGVDMAVYAYSAENYAYWRKEMPGEELPYGKFGENLTITGLDDSTVHIGDLLRIGPTGTGGRGVTVQVSVMRAPCWKLAMVMGSAEFVKVFLNSYKLGWYMRVLEEGRIEAGDEVSIERRDPAGLSIEQLTRVWFFGQDDIEGARRAAGVDALPTKWRDRLRERAEKAGG